MVTKKTLGVWCLAAAAALAAVPAAGAAFDVAIDVTPLAGRPGWLAFDLVAGDAPGDSNVAITAFSTLGAIGQSRVTGSVTGSLLAPPLVLSSTAFFSEWLQGVTFAAGVVRFRIDVPAAAIGGAIPDAFSFFLLDVGFVPFATSDPTGANALFVIDLDATPVPELYRSAFATVSVVPEPPTWWLLLVGAALLQRRFKV